MGDRANILVVDEKEDGAVKGGIYLYTHWEGYRWPEALRSALDAARSRWGHPSYCTRIIVSQAFSEIHNSETGGGISTYRTDNQHPIIICDQEDEIVAFVKPGEEKDVSRWFAHQTFADFIKNVPATYPEGDN